MEFICETGSKDRKSKLGVLDVCIFADLRSVYEKAILSKMEVDVNILLFW